MDDASKTCYWATDERTCFFDNGQAGDLGTACDGATGNCVAPPGDPGACCPRLRLSRR